MRYLIAILLTCVGCGRLGFEATDRDGATTEDGPMTEDGSRDGAARAWSLSEVVASDTGAPVTLQSTAQGDLVIVAIAVGGSVVAIGDNRNNTYVAIPAAQCQHVNSGLLEIWYADGVAANTTTISVTTAPEPSAQAFVVWVVANMRTSNALDTATAVSLQPASSTPNGPSVTTASSGEFVVSAVKATVVSGIRAGNAFTNDSLALGDGYAHLMDASAAAGTYQAQWDSTNDPYCASAAAFFARP